MAGILKGIKDKASSAMGLDKDKKALEEEKEAHEETKSRLAEADKKVMTLQAALKEAELKLQKMQARAQDLQNTLDAINAEKEAAADAEAKKRQAEAQAAMAKATQDVAEKQAAVAHCQQLYDAMKGLMADDEKIADAIAPYPWSHVQLMIQTYLANFGQDLVHRVKGRTSGLFRDLMLGLLQSPEDYVVGLLNDAIHGLTTDDQLLVELLCSATNAEVKTYKEIFQKRFNKDMAKVVPDATSGELKKILVAVMQAAREEKTDVDQAQVDSDATMLYAAGEARLVGVDDAPFIQILTNRSGAHLIALNEHYKTKSKRQRSLVEAVERQFSGKVRDALMTMLASNMDRPLYFATLIHEAVHGLGCNEPPIVRTLVGRRYKDLALVRVAYNKGFTDDEGKKKPFDERLAEELGSGLKSAAMKILATVK